MKLSRLVLLGLLSGTLLWSCEKDDNNTEPVNQDPVNISFKVNYVFGSQALPWELNKMMLHPKTGDSLSFSSFKFYLSNIKLQKTDGSWWEEENSYHLIDAASSPDGAFTLEGVPAGNYDRLEFMVGIDSARIVDGPYDGDLDPSKGMSFGNNEGYIMLFAEGSSPQATDGQFHFALGDYQAPFNMTQERSFSFFGETWSLSGGSSHEITLVSNPAKLWHYAPGLTDNDYHHGGGEAAELMSREFFGAVGLQAAD